MSQRRAAVRRGSPDDDRRRRHHPDRQRLQGRSTAGSPRSGCPRTRLAMFQVVEYLRAFLAGRVTHSAFGGLLIISGAFGIFRRDGGPEAGGFRHDTIGEDMEMVTRLHRICLERKQPYRLVFQPDPVCWTEAPETIRILSRQRNRWQRGAVQVLGFHKPLMGNPQYGVSACWRCRTTWSSKRLDRSSSSRLRATVVAVAFGLLDWRFAEMLFLRGALRQMISLMAVILEELSFNATAVERSAPADRPGHHRELRLPPVDDVVADLRDLRLPSRQGRGGDDAQGVLREVALRG